jgi:3-deoxy-D-manno-octulosonic-acid transferase
MILHTTITQTGQAVARRSAVLADEIAYFPIDFLPISGHAMNNVRPDVFVMVDTEIWPNFLALARRRGIKTVLVNGRISDKTLDGGRRWAWLLGWATSNIDVCLMQTDEDGFRIISLGARPQAIHVVGSTKFDEAGGQLPPDEVDALRADLGLPEAARVLVAGSTNPGEDEPVLDAFQTLRHSGDGASDLRLIIAPRQLDRADEIRGLVEARGFTCARRSMKETIAPGSYDVLLLDTFGELASAYAVGAITFVGGSLIPKGGHSIFQPILQGKPVLFGPYTHKTRDMAQMALTAGVGFVVKDAAEFAVQAGALLSDPERLAEIDTACRELVEKNRGASTRCAETIVKLLETEHGG